MKRKTTDGGPVQVTDHIWIPMPDGARLAARLWLPDTAQAAPVPAVFEYIPYRKADMVRGRDERNHPYLAENGIAALRIDMRGSGDSDGIMADMYAPAELDDARRIVEWIAAQPWCTGHVGMFGTSWGGTAALQISRDKPDALKAVIAVCATHDRYEDDIHHKGGCLLTDTLEWGATLPTILGAPPTPNVGGDWKETWRDRLEKLAFPLETWVREEARGAYWRHGSVKHDMNRLDCPILAVGGWSDRYSNSVISLVDARPDLVWGVVGPWGHHYPDQGHPGPAMGFQALALDWWQHWLRDDPGGPPDMPRLRVWLRDHEPPQDAIDERSGEWIDAGPSQDLSVADHWHLTASGLDREDGGAIDVNVPTNLRLGTAAGDTGYYGRFGGLPLDQRDEDALCLGFETQALEDDYVLFGHATLDLSVSTGSARQQLSVRLCDVAPDGSSSRIALSVRNLCLDERLDAPTEPQALERQRVTIPFHAKAYRLRKGHRLRLAIGASYWPMIWTPPVLGRITVHSGVLRLPHLADKPRPTSRPVPPVRGLPEQKNWTVIHAPVLERTRHTDPDGTLCNGWYQPPVRVRYHETATEFEYETRAEHRIDPCDPLTAKSTFDHRMTFDRPDGSAVVRCTVAASCDADAVFLDGRFEASWDGENMATHIWKRDLPRRYF